MAILIVMSQIQIVRMKSRVLETLYLTITDPTATNAVTTLTALQRSSLAVVARMASSFPQK